MIGACCNFHVNTEQRETNLIRVEAAVSGGGALRDDPNNGCGADQEFSCFKLEGNHCKDKGGQSENNQAQDTMWPGAHFLKALKSFRTQKVIAKSQSF